jgi:hypothetical protein
VPLPVERHQRARQPPSPRTAPPSVSPSRTDSPPAFMFTTPRRSSANAAWGGLTPPPVGRRRRANDPPSLAKHHFRAICLHQTPFSVRDTQMETPKILISLRLLLYLSEPYYVAPSVLRFPKCVKGEPRWIQSVLFALRHRHGLNRKRCKCRNFLATKVRGVERFSHCHYHHQRRKIGRGDGSPTN